mmetsp:Transcript_22019/g.52104  ORF Transcript_22019/g.52104 Transcript_22019/m.52104 type:complete len:240 (+) Transcript_22019:349-1068(+)
MVCSSPGPTPACRCRHLRDGVFHRQLSRRESLDMDGFPDPLDHCVDHCVSGNYSGGHPVPEGAGTTRQREATDRPGPSCLGILQPCPSHECSRGPTILDTGLHSWPNHQLLDDQSSWRNMFPRFDRWKYPLQNPHPDEAHRPRRSRRGPPCHMDRFERPRRHRRRKVGRRRCRPEQCRRQALLGPQLERRSGQSRHHQRPRHLRRDSRHFCVVLDAIDLVSLADQVRWVAEVHLSRGWR